MFTFVMKASVAVPRGVCCFIKCGFSLEQVFRDIVLVLCAYFCNAWEIQWLAPIDKLRASKLTTDCDITAAHLLQYLSLS